LQPTLRDQLLASRENRFAVRGKPQLCCSIVVGHLPEYLAARWIDHELRGALRNRAEQVAKLRATIAPDHNLLTSDVVMIREAREFAQESHPTISNDVTLDHAERSASESIAAARTRRRRLRSPASVVCFTLDYHLEYGVAIEQCARQTVASPSLASDGLANPASIDRPP
jgi:hypothetical protein